MSHVDAAPHPREKGATLYHPLSTPRLDGPRASLHPCVPHLEGKAKPRPRPSIPAAGSGRVEPGRSDPRMWTSVAQNWRASAYPPPPRDARRIPASLHRRCMDRVWSMENPHAAASLRHRLRWCVIPFHQAQRTSRAYCAAAAAAAYAPRARPHVVRQKPAHWVKTAPAFVQMTQEADSNLSSSRLEKNHQLTSTQHTQHS